MHSIWIFPEIEMKWYYRELYLFLVNRNKIMGINL
jgi:hypothetical protein